MRSRLHPQPPCARGTTQPNHTNSEDDCILVWDDFILVCSASMQYVNGDVGAGDAIFKATRVAFRDISLQERFVSGVCNECAF